MRQHRFVPKAPPSTSETPFSTAEEAWFWYVRSQVLRRSGARLSASRSAFQRPCDPDDIYRAALTLAKDRVLSREHLRTLARFGLLERPPDPRLREEEWAVVYWQQALDRLSTVLRAKGVVG